MAAAPLRVGLVKNADGYDEVAARVKPSATNLWDLPGGIFVDVMDEWVQCEYDKRIGYIKAKNLPGVEGHKPGALVEVKDSYKGNSETCMRRHPEQDATVGNVLCYVPNGPSKVKLVEHWVEFRWKGHKGFVKARHVQAAPAGAVAGSGAGAFAAGGGRPPPAGAPQAKRARIGGAAVAAAAAGSSADAAAPALVPAPAPAIVEPVEKAPVEAPAAAAGEAADGAEVAAEPVAMDTEEAPAPEAPAPAAVAEPCDPPAAPPAVVVPAAAPGAPAAPAAAAPAAAPAAPAGEERNCDCCFESVPTSGGILCPGKAHFFCSECLTNFLTAFKTAEYAEQKKGKGRALCPMKDSETPFGDGALVSHVPQDVFDDYLQIRIKVAEKGIQEQIEKENADKIEELKEKLAKAEGTGEQAELDKHRLKIIDDIFTLKCPRCKLAFFDYDNCSAISCAGCGCGFCSYCLEDCGKDAHQHFYKNKSKCPKEGGPLFIDHKKWSEYQSRRKGKLLWEYIAKLPEGKRKALCDLVAPDAKDLGIEMPEDLSTEALDPGAHGIVTMRITVPRKLRAGLADKAAASLKKGDVKLKVPDAKDKVRICAAGPQVFVKLHPTNSHAKKDLAARLADDFMVSIDDDWVEIECPKEKIPCGWVKNKHVVGKPEPGKKANIKDAGGFGSTMVRKLAKQDEGKNVVGYVNDGVECKVRSHWVEIVYGKVHAGAGSVSFKGDRGFVRAEEIADDDVTLTGKKADCQTVAEALEKILGVPLSPKVPGLAAIEHGGRGRGRGGRGRGRGRG